MPRWQDTVVLVICILLLSSLPQASRLFVGRRWYKILTSRSKYWYVHQWKHTGGDFMNVAPSTARLRIIVSTVISLCTWFRCTEDNKPHSGPRSKCIPAPSLGQHTLPYGSSLVGQGPHFQEPLVSPSVTDQLQLCSTPQAAFFVSSSLCQLKAL